MGKAPCCSKVGLHRGPWSAEEDMVLTNYIQTHGEGQWRSLPKKAGLLRCGKSCRLRWMNYLRPGIKRGNISADEEDLILRLHKLLGNRWSLIAGRLPGRTDNEIKNYWNTHLTKKLKNPGIDLKGGKIVPKEGKIRSKKNVSRDKKHNLKDPNTQNGKPKLNENMEKVEVLVPKPIRVISGSSSINNTDTALCSSSSHEVNNEKARVERTVSYSKSHADEYIQENMSHFSDWDLCGLGDIDFGFDTYCCQGDDQVLIDGGHLLFEDPMMPSINNMVEKVYEEYLQLL